MALIEEPGQCRAVVSAPVLRAILRIGLLWGWYRFCGIIALGFEGMLHPNEFLALRRVFLRVGLRPVEMLLVH